MNASKLTKTIARIDNALENVKACSPWNRRRIRELEAKRARLIEAFDVVEGFEELGVGTCPARSRRTVRRRTGPSYVPPKHLAEGSIVDDIITAWNGLW